MSKNPPPKNITLNSHQQVVLECLRKASEPLSAYKILEAVPKSMMSAAQQVYRALDKLIAYGMAHRIESLNAYVACTHKDCSDDHALLFALCGRCGKASEFRANKAIKQLYKKTKKFDFRVDTAHIELRGLCEACQISLKTQEQECNHQPG